MVRLLAVLGFLGALSACGVDGAPLPPDTRDRPEPGISISGSAQMGVAGGSGMSARPVSRIKGAEIGLVR